MKNKPKKIAAYLEVNKQELKYLLYGLERANLTLSCARDYNEEDLQESLKAKLHNALISLEE